MPSKTIVKKAIATALQSSAHTLHGAVIHKGRRFICGAYNIRYKSHPDGGGFYSTAHAELRAIVKAKRLLRREDLKGYSIFVLRIGKDGSIMKSKPCPCCEKLIKKANLKADWTDEND